MKLTILGWAGSFPAADSPCSSYVVEADDFRLMVDFGTGAIGVLQRLELLHRIDAVLISHLHLDHCDDAAAYTIVRRYDPHGPFRKLPLYGPKGVDKRIAHIAANPNAVKAVYQTHIVTPGHRDIGPFSVTAVRMNHPGETYGYRIEHQGRIFAYSADTGATPALVKLAHHADLFLCEASFSNETNNPANIHLSGQQAGEYAAHAQVKRLVLTHLIPKWVSPTVVTAEAKAAFTGPVEAARSGVVYHV